MIGDWVYDKHYNGDIEPIQIHNIYGNDVNCKTERNRFDVEEIVSGTYIKNLMPIPLTPEILEKNGFENDFYHDESVADYHFIRLEGYSYREDFVLVTWCNGELNVVNDLIGEVEIHCENVHELQHALRLCGIEKEVEI